MLAAVAAAVISAGPPAGALREPAIDWTPRRVVLGEAPALTLRVRLREASPGTPAPRLAATVGRLSAPERTGAEEWTATLSLPAGGPPLLAIVSAAREEPGEEPRVAFAAIPLRGRATVPVATEAGARVEVSCGGEEVGPFTAGKDGLVEVALAVAPGVTSARVRATGRGGQTEETVDLGVPPPNRLALVATAAGPGRLRIDAFTAGGRRLPALSASRGELAGPVPVPGQPERSVAFLSGPPGLVAVRGSVRGDPASAGEISAHIPAPPAAAAEAPAAPTPEVEARAAWVRLAPSRALSLSLGVRVRGNASGLEMYAAHARRLGVWGGWSAGFGAGVFLRSSERAEDALAGRASLRLVEAGILPEGWGRLDLPALFLFSAGGPAVTWSCAAGSTFAAGQSCAAGLAMSLRLGLGFRLREPGPGPGLSLTVEYGLRAPLAGGGLPAASGAAGGQAAQVGLSFTAP